MTRIMVTIVKGNGNSDNNNGVNNAFNEEKDKYNEK